MVKVVNVGLCIMNNLKVIGCIVLALWTAQGRQFLGSIEIENAYEDTEQVKDDILIVVLSKDCGKNILEVSVLSELVDCTVHVTYIYAYA